MANSASRWSYDNQKFLFGKIREIKNVLRHPLGSHSSPDADLKIAGGSASIASTQASGEEWSSEGAPAIDILSSLFGLTKFERDVLMLCAAFELDKDVARLCAEVQRNPRAPYPTFELAMSIFQDPHWSALTPVAPLRKFRLIHPFYGGDEINSNNNSAIVAVPLRIDERILHYLMGISYLEGQLQGLVKPVNHDLELVNSHWNVVSLILQACRNVGQGTKQPIIQLLGKDESSKEAVANQVCAQIGLSLWQMPLDFVPTKPDELESLIQMWTRESALLGASLFISAQDAEPPIQRMIRRLIEDIPGPVFLSSRERWPGMGNNSLSNGILLSVDVSKPERTEQAQIWKRYIGDGINLNDQLKDKENELTSHLDRELSRLVDQFNLNTAAIRTAAIEARINILQRQEQQDDQDQQERTLQQLEEKKIKTSVLWEAARRIARPRMADLAQLIIPSARMEDLILHEKEKKILREVIIHVKNREKVYQDWGFESSGSRGLGISALFAGESGTGKTMAAEVLANELKLDLFRIDLSTVVSKYIGETEKNLRQVFDAAEDGGAILFFDEADALFGKRSEVHDSHDRYANIEVGYLLQRMEAYSGLAILATNIRDAIDPAFMRRIRFAINFPFPDEKSRAEIWRGIFPKATPTKDLDIDRLARLNITGGSIRNIALNASFLAAEEGSPVGMEHIKQAAQSEYDKLERPLTSSEFGG